MLFVGAGRAAGSGLVYKRARIVYKRVSPGLCIYTMLGLVLLISYCGALYSMIYISIVLYIIYTIFVLACIIYRFYRLYDPLCIMYQDSIYCCCYQE